VEFSLRRSEKISRIPVYHIFIIWGHTFYYLHIDVMSIRACIWLLGILHSRDYIMDLNCCFSSSMMKLIAPETLFELCIIYILFDFDALADPICIKRVFWGMMINNIYGTVFCIPFLINSLKFAQIRVLRKQTCFTLSTSKSLKGLFRNELV
jgi:hypothetical protein